MPEDRKEAELEVSVDGSRRRLALALLGGFAGASLLEACEEDPGASRVLGPQGAQRDLGQTQQRLVESRHFDTIAALKAFDTSGLTEGALASVSGYFAPNDGGHGEFYFSPNPPVPPGSPPGTLAPEHPEKTEYVDKTPGVPTPPGATVTSQSVMVEGTNFISSTGNGKWLRLGVNSKVRRVRRPEEWGADNTGVRDSTYALQAGLLWCEKNHAYLQGLGKYRISDTLYVTGTGWGFEFGPAGDIYVDGSTGGLIWYGGDHPEGINENTYKAMIEIGRSRPAVGVTPTPEFASPGVLGLACGPICLNNRVNRSKGICGVRWTSYTAQSIADFKQLEVYGMDGGLILGTRAYTSNSGPFPRDDVGEQSVFSIVRMFEVKHPIYINGSTNDMITFENVFAGAYQQGTSGLTYWNGPSEYGIRVNSIQNGLSIKKLCLGQMDMVTDAALIDLVVGGLDIGLANLENGNRTCLAFRATVWAAGRGPLILRNFYTSNFRDSQGAIARIDAPYGVIMDGCSWQGNVHITQNTGFVTGTCLFVGNYNFTGSVDRRVSVATFFDTDGNYQLDNKRVGGPHNADTYSALTSVTAPILQATGTIKNSFSLERTSQVDVAPMAAGAPKDLFDVVFTSGAEGAAVIDLECLFYRGNAMANTFAWKASARYTIHKTAAGVFTVRTSISVPPDAEKAFVGSFTTANAVASAVQGTNKVTLQLTHTNNLNDVARAQLKATMIHFPSTVALNPLTT